MPDYWLAANAPRLHHDFQKNYPVYYPVFDLLKLVYLKEVLG